MGGAGESANGRSALSGGLLLAVASGHAALSVILHPGWVFGKYPNLAGRLARGELTPAQVADASPAYLLANLLASPEAIRLVQAGLGGVAVVLAFAIANRVAGRPAGWIAALALALSGPWLMYSAVLEPDLPIGVLSAAAVACLVVPVDGPRRAWSALAGALLGLSVALRPSGLVLVLASLGWLAVGAVGHARPGRRAGATIAFLLAVVPGAILPAVVLHARVGQEWKSTMSVGQVLHQGHRPEGTGLGASYPTLLALAALEAAKRPGHLPDVHHELYRSFAAAATGTGLSPAAAERYWIGKAVAFARAEPWAFVRQLGRKVVFALVAPAGDADIPAVQALEQSRRFDGIPFRWISLAGLAGLVLALRERGRIRLVQLWVVAYLLVYAVFYYQSRYGLAILPAWCVLAGTAGVSAWQARGDRRRALAVALAAALALLPLAPHWVRDADRVLLRIARVPVQSEAVSLRAEGRWDEARSRLADEQAAFPDLPWPWSAHGYGLQAGAPEAALRAAGLARARFGAESPVDAYLLAVLLAGGERCDEAIPLARKASEAGFRWAVADTSLDPDLLLADCQLALGDREEALRSVERSLSRWPGTLDGLARAVAGGEAQPGASAPDVARREAELLALHDPASARYALARARRRWGAPLAAVADAEWVRRNVPDAAPLADFELALSWLDLGRPAEALRAYARSLVGGFAMHESSRMDDPVRALVAARPDDPDALRLAFAHWSARGEVDEIRALLRAHPGLAGPGGAP